MAWTRDGSAQCDRGEHTTCNGYARVIDQDGYSTYVCGCHCHAIEKAARKADDDEREFRWVCASFKRKLGAERFNDVLADVAAGGDPR
jgi:hypothetical protein